MNALPRQSTLCAMALVNQLPCKAPTGRTGHWNPGCHYVPTAKRLRRQREAESLACTLCGSKKLLAKFRGKPVCQSCLQDAHEAVSRSRNDLL